MLKKEFIEKLKAKLAHLPQKDVEERLTFYMEMIEDRMEDGLAEEDAVAAVGSVEDIAKQIAAEIPTAKAAEEKATDKKQFPSWAIVLLVLGFPVWFPLLIAACSVAISLYCALWSLVIALWAIFIATAICAPATVIAGIIFCCTGNPTTGVASLGAGLLCGAIAICLSFTCKVATKEVSSLIKKVILAIKKRLTKKEVA